MTSLFFLATEAQLPIPLPSIDIAPFVQFGVLGIVLYWFMFRLEKRMDRHSATIDDLTRSITLEILCRSNITTEIRGKADEILDRVNQRTTKYAPADQN